MELKRIILFVFLLGIFVPSFAQNKFSEGIKAFEESEFENASVLFHAHIDEFPLDYLAYYNLGNAYYHQKKYPHALWAFEKSLKINPRFEDAAMNAKMSYKRTGLHGEWKHADSIFTRLLFGLQKNFWAMITLGITLIISISLYLFFTSSKPGVKRALLLTNGITGFFLVVVLVLALLHKNHLTSENHGIIVVATANAKASPDENEKTLFAIPGGQKVVILRTLDEWVEVRISTENVGWLKYEDLKTF